MSEPFLIPWTQGRDIRVRHDDPHLGIYTGSGQQLRAAIYLASEVDVLRRALASCGGISLPDHSRTPLFHLRAHHEHRFMAACGLRSSCLFRRRCGSVGRCSQAPLTVLAQWGGLRLWGPEP